MTVERQRFCPHCDRALEPGEAVLRCRNCGVLHHPNCWIRNDGCSSGCDEDAPEPRAYSMPVARQAESGAAEGEPLIGGDPPAGRARPNAGSKREAVLPLVKEPPPRAQRGRYPDASRSVPPVEDMRLYRRGGILRYWYVPIAGVLAILIAVGIVWAADEYLIGGDNGTPADAVDVDATATAEAGASDDAPTPLPTITPEGGAGTPDGTPTGGTSAPAGELAPGTTAVVTGTDSCLRIRAAAGTENTEVACVSDGIQISIVGGPEDAGGLTWWQVETDHGDGWAAGDYLRPN